jgi:hypothetical protein
MFVLMSPRILFYFFKTFSSDWNAIIKHEKFWKMLIECSVGYKIKEYESTDSNFPNVPYPWYKMYRQINKSSWTWRRAVRFDFHFLKTSIFNTFDDHFRVLFLGDKKVGKTALLFRLIRERFQSEQYFIKNISKFEMASRTTRVMNLKTDTTVKLQFVKKYYFSQLLSSV